MDTEQVVRHFGYDARDRAGWSGNWPNDGTAIDRLESLPEVLRKVYKGKTRLRVTFDLDPDFQRALLQIWGLEPVTLSPDGEMEEKMAWMKNVGIVKLPEPVSYLYQFKGHDAVWLLTEREVAEKPLDELRTMFERDREEARVSVETRKGQTMRRVICRA